MIKNVWEQRQSSERYCPVSVGVTFGVFEPGQGCLLVQNAARDALRFMGPTACKFVSPRMACTSGANCIITPATVPILYVLGTGFYPHKPPPTYITNSGRLGHVVLCRFMCVCVCGGRAAFHIVFTILVFHNLCELLSFYSLV